MERADITIVGAGVIGLAIAAEISKSCQNIFVIEKNTSFGQEISSRNSEVVHAGIYYPKDSLKAKTCTEGNYLLYEFCSKNNIPHKKTGKLIVTVDKKELGGIEVLFKQGLENGLTDLKILTKNEVKALEPHIEAEAAIYSPQTGIIDSYTFMKKLSAQLKSHDGNVAYNTELTGIDKTNGGFLLAIRDKIENVFKFETRILINCAGLNSDRVAAMAGLTKEEYRLKYCKGDYFRLSSTKARFINHLIYPIPKKNRSTLGIHATLDLQGGLRLGPDEEYVDKIDYSINEAKKTSFFEGARKFLPFIELDDLWPDTSGIRPKLQGPDEGFRDFIIKGETENNLPGFINLIGIESPGLTSSLSIARIVREMVESQTKGIRYCNKLC